VREDLSVPGHPEIFVIGDLAAFSHQTGAPLPGIAPVAMQQARHAARNILAALRGEETTPFRYRDRGSMATIGRAAAVADFGRVRLAGVTAWFSWLFIHIFFLIGFRSRLLVLIQWAYSYLTFRRGARLITGELEPGPAPPGSPPGEPAGAAVPPTGPTPDA
jgi:NADH:ubiquinone reductase (H+-translocating)